MTYSLWKKAQIACLFLAIFLPMQFTNAQLPFANNDQTYQETVQTVLLHPTEDALGLPIFMLNETETLKLSFDILGDNAYTYNYTMIHCSHNWETTDLKSVEYLEGYPDDQITQFRFSLNTLTPYVHYDLVFPTDNIKPKLSGNYLLVVFDGELATGKILLTRRFMVVVPLVQLLVSIPQYPRDNTYIGTHQQVDIQASLPQVLMGITSNAFKLNIQQNGRKDNIVVNLPPTQAYNGRMLYEYTDKTVFEGSNQWRNLDLKSFKYQSERIDRIITGTDYFTVKLWEDQQRHRKQYVSETDIHGKKLIKAREDQDTDIEGDYAWVEFFIQFSPPLTHGEMHLLGALNDWNLDAKSRLKYNFQRKGYEGFMFLKQGFYNYLYGIKEAGNATAETALTEGNHWETLNEYFVSMYFRQPGTSYDQLVGTQLILSH